MSPRTGRPPIDNPKNARVTIRLDAEDMSILEEYCKRKSIDKAQAIREAIRQLKN